MTAHHFDPYMGEGMHQHTWAVTAFWPSIPFRDGRPLKAALSKVLSVIAPAPYIDALPNELWSGEAIAERVARLLPECIGCRVTRPEGFEAWVWL